VRGCVVVTRACELASLPERGARLDQQPLKQRTLRVAQVHIDVNASETIMEQAKALVPM